MLVLELMVARFVDFGKIFRVTLHVVGIIFCKPFIGQQEAALPEATPAPST